MYGDDETEEVRVFTLGEARGLVPRLRKLLARVTKEREALLDLRVEIDLAKVVVAARSVPLILRT